jgi:flagellar basal-body rod protein FlgB
MSNSWIDDVTMRSLRVGLDGLSLRQQVISQNIANIDTPGYQAKQVNFEDAIRRALSKQDQIPLRVTDSRQISSGKSEALGMNISNRPGGSFRTDQNNVDIDVELSDMSEAGIQYQALTQAASKKLLLLKTIAMSR